MATIGTSSEISESMIATSGTSSEIFESTIATSDTLSEIFESTIATSDTSSEIFESTMAGSSIKSESSELFEFDLQQRKSVLEREMSQRGQGLTIYRADSLLRELKEEHFNRNIIPLGLFHRCTRDSFSGASGTMGIEHRGIQLKVDVAITFFEDTKMDLKDWIKVSKEVIDKPKEMKSLYDGRKVHFLEDEIVESALALDAIFVTCFLSYALVHRKYSSSHPLPIKCFLVKTLPRTLGFLSRESDGSVSRIFQEILKLENQIPLSTIDKVIKILLLRATEVNGQSIDVNGQSMRVNDILREICTTFVWWYWWIFPCMKHSGTGLAEAPAEGTSGAAEASIKQKPNNRVESPLPKGSTSRSETHPPTTQDGNPAAQIPDSTSDPVGTAAVHAMDIPDALATDHGCSGRTEGTSRASINQRPDNRVETQTEIQAAANSASTPDPAPNPITDDTADTGTGIPDSDAAVTDHGCSAESQRSQGGKDLIHCDHLLHCLAQVIWSKATHGAATPKQERHPSLGGNFLFCIKGVFHLFRRCFRRSTNILSHRKYHPLLQRRIPTANELRKRGVRFRGQDELFPKIRPHYFWWWSATLFLPRIIMIEDRTEESWRNLLAFEDAYYTHHRKPDPNSKSFTSFLTWMDELIDGEEDVAALMEGADPVIVRNSEGNCKTVATLINSVIKEHVFVKHERWTKISRELNDFRNDTFLRTVGIYLTPKFIKPWLLCSAIAAIIVLGLAGLQAVYTLSRLLNHSDCC